MRQTIAKSFISIVTLSGLISTPSDAAQRPAEGTVALVNVRVVSMNPDERTPVKKRQTVIVEAGRIVEIGKKDVVEIPSGAQVIQGKNKLTVLPGLADMHIHNNPIPQIPEGVSPEELYAFYLANGVTTLFDLSGFKAEFKWQKDLERGKVLGPNLAFTTPSIDEADYASLGELEADMRQWKREGYAYVKCHSTQTLAFFERVHELARELNLPVITHALRPGFPIQETLAQEPLAIAHIEEILSTSVAGSADFQGQLETPLVDVANSRTWVTTTVNTYETIANTRNETTFRELLNRPEMRFLPPSIRQLWEFQNRFHEPQFSGSDRAFWLGLLDMKLYIARRLEQLGALDRLLLGTDVGVHGIVPGFAIHNELRLLVQAGLTPWEAILTGTYNPAVFFDSLDETGTVEVGKRADLIVAKKNPLKKIGRLQNLAGVLINGVWLSEEELDAQLEKIAARWVD